MIIHDTGPCTDYRQYQFRAVVWALDRAVERGRGSAWSYIMDMVKCEMGMRMGLGLGAVEPVYRVSVRLVL